MKKLIFKILILAVLGSSALPVYSEQPAEPIEWNQLSAETREILAPMAERWNNLKPHQQQKWLRRAENKVFQDRAERWNNLSQEERDRIQKARQRFKDMPPEKREKLRTRWESMSEEERKAARKAGHMLRHLPPQQRREALKAMRDMTPKERRQYLKKLKPKDRQDRSNKDDH